MAMGEVTAVVVRAVGRGGRRWLVEEDGQGAIADAGEGRIYELGMAAAAALGRGYWDAPKPGDQAAFEAALPGLERIPATRELRS